MATPYTPMFPGLLLDAATRYATDHAAAGAGAGASPRDPVRELGWCATLVPEAAGGADGTLADLAAVVEGLAGQGVQLPVIETCGVVPLLLRAASPEIANRWLEAVADGSVRIAPLVPLAAMPDEPVVRATHLDIGHEVSGELFGVDATLPASHWLVPAEADGEPAIFLVEAERVGAPAATYRTMEGRRAVDIVLDRLAVPEVACLARGAAAHDALAAAADAALLLAGVDTVAALAALIERTATHLKERRQFGVALATFQVLRHRLADLYVRYLGAKGLVLHCLEAHEARADDLRRTLRLAKLSLGETARTCAEAAIQCHGGMGVSEEVPATRLAQRLIAAEFRHGDRLMHLRQLLHRPAADARSSLSTLAERNAR